MKTIKTPLKILGIALVALISCNSMLTAQCNQNPTATYGGKKFERRNGRTWSNGRLVNPFGHKIKRYRPKRDQHPTATYGGRKFERRNGRTFSNGREVSPFGPKVKRYRPKRKTHPTAIYGGKKFERRNGRTFSNGREVNPFGPKIKRYQSKQPKRPAADCKKQVKHAGGGLTGAMNRVAGLIGG